MGQRKAKIYNERNIFRLFLKLTTPHQPQIQSAGIKFSWSACWHPSTIPYPVTDSWLLREACGEADGPIADLGFNFGEFSLTNWEIFLCLVSAGEVGFLLALFFLEWTATGVELGLGAAGAFGAELGLGAAGEAELPELGGCFLVLLFLLLGVGAFFRWSGVAGPVPKGSTPLQLAIQSLILGGTTINFFLWGFATFLLLGGINPPTGVEHCSMAWEGTIKSVDWPPVIL